MMDSVSEVPRAPAPPDTSSDNAFRDDVARSLPSVPTNSELDRGGAIDSLFAFSGSSEPDSPLVHLVYQDGGLKSFDKAGNLTAVEFHNEPDKNHHYGYNDKNELISVDRTDRYTGEDLHLKRDEKTDKWYLEKNDNRYNLPGKVELQPTGDFSVQRKDGSWRTENLDGEIIDERRLASGAIIRLNEDSTINNLTRADKSWVQCSYTADGALQRLVEAKDGKYATWSRRDNGDFVQEGSDEVRKNLVIDKNGNVNFKSADGIDHVITGDGSHVVSAADSKNTSTYDSEGRLALFTKTDGSARKFEYEGDTTRVSKLTELNSKGEPGKTYERTKDDEWKCTEGDKSLGNWHGDLKTSLDGSWSMFSGNKKDNPNAIWRDVDAKEKTTYSRVNPDGSKISFDSQKRFSEIQRADGSVIAWNFNGDTSKITATMVDQTEIQFDFDLKSRQWKCSDPTIKSSPKMPIDGSGELTFQKVDGSTVLVKTDNSTTVTRSDGTALKYDSAQNLIGIAKGGNERTFEINDGQLSFTDKIKGLLERRVDLSHDHDIEVTAAGDLIHTTAIGRRQIETSDFAHVDCNDAGKPEKIKAANGSVRQIEWNPQTNEPVSITDSMRIGEKDISRKWETGGPEWKGTFAVISEKDGKLTQGFARHDLQVDDVGNYSYLSGDGRKATSKAGDGVRVADNGWGSADVEEARTNFIDAMRQNFSGARMERIESMSSGFETRMTSTIERRMASGESEEKVRAEVEQRIRGTYDNLAKMVLSDDTQSFDSKNTRLNLAETYMYHAMEPETITQGPWGSCWLQSGYVPCGIGEHPDAIAKVLSDVALTGNYTDLSHRTYNFDRNHLAIANAAQGAGWTIEGAPRTNYPSPVAHRLDATLAAMDRGANYQGAGNVNRIISGGGGQREIMRRVTGDELQFVVDYPRTREERAALLHSGGAQRQPRQNHVATWALRKEKDNWLLIRGNQNNNSADGDRAIAVIRDLKTWLDNGEFAPINQRFIPGVGGEFKVVGDAIKPSDYRPGHRSNEYNPEQRFAGRRRWRFFR